MKIFLDTIAYVGFKPIPSNDIWIAAQSVEHGAELITCDRHFQHIAGLVHSLVAQ
ncbi:MAG: PIN domain-containing protein [Desulfosarcina sp.]